MALRSILGSCGIALLGLAMGADAHEFRILHAEPVKPSSRWRVWRPARADSNSPTSMSFQAYGRHLISR